MVARGPRRVGGEQAAVIDLGPNTGTYLTGFADFYEIDMNRKLRVMVP